MLWGPDDWDAWTVTAPPPAAGQGAIPEVTALLRDLPGRRTMTVADLGCGRGALLPFLAAHFLHVVAIDYAPVSLATARGALRGADVTFRRRDLRDLAPFRNRFHVAVALDAILGPRWSDVDRILREVHASLRDGGHLVAKFPGTAPGAGPLPLAGEPDAEPSFHEVALQFRLRASGFRGIRIKRAGEELLAVAVRRGNN